MSYVWLAVAILFELTATLAMKAATDGRRTWYLVTFTGYPISYGALTLALAEGMGVGVAYGVWVSAGVSLTALASKFLFGEPFTPVMVGGVSMIVIGVLCIELGAAH